MTDQPELCHRCGNQIQAWEPSIRRLAGNNIDVRHASTADCKPTPKPKDTPNEKPIRA